MKYARLTKRLFAPISKQSCEHLELFLKKIYLRTTKTDEHKAKNELVETENRFKQSNLTEKKRKKKEKLKQSGNLSAEYASKRLVTSSGSWLAFWVS